MIRVKICGNRTVEEAHNAVHYGADAVGILVGPHSDQQKHFVGEGVAREIIQSLPPFITGVIVTTHNTVETISAVIEATCAPVIQCHSDISTEDIAKLCKLFPAMRFIAVVHVKDRGSIERAKQYASVAHALLLDTAQKGITGGTGVTHDWSVSAEICTSVSVPVILAGGLTPENVSEAIAIVQPRAVDVRSGVCTLGEKDNAKMEAFITKAHAV